VAGEFLLVWYQGVKRCIKMPGFKPMTLSSSSWHQQGPYEIHQWLFKAMYVNDRKPDYGSFVDNSKGKIGKQRLENRLKWMSDIPWRRDWTDDGLRVFLKERINFKFERQ